MGEHLNIEWSPIFLWRKIIMKNKLKSLVCSVLALVMVLSCITPVSAATVDIGSRSLSLKRGSELLLITVPGNGGAARDGKIETIIRSSAWSATTQHYDLKDIRTVTYVDDVAVATSDANLARHEAGFLIRFSMKDDSRNESSGAGYVYVSGVENTKYIDVSSSNNNLVVSSDKATIYSTGCKSIGKVPKRFAFTAKSIVVKNGKAYFLMNKKFKKVCRNSYGKKVTKKINVLIGASDTTVA